MIQTIQALSEACINHIAAGEVIERPASVVKELVENAIDAGSDKIEIQIAGGGRQLVQINDNGRGMHPEDLKICFRRYTTSKLRDPKDLFGIQTNGFRGEALSSISAVSKMSIESCHHEEDTGYRLSLTGENIDTEEEFAREAGTTIRVENLFYNTPVRAKFLASAQTETNRICDVMNRLALAHPSIEFTLIQEGKRLLHTRAGSMETRMAEILGTQTARHMQSVDGSYQDIEIHGYIGNAQTARARRKAQYIFVDKRPIWNPAVQRAISQAWEQVHPPGHPAAVLFIHLAPEDYDVNVHPAKREVRFSRESEVFQAVLRTVRNTLKSQKDMEMESSSFQDFGAGSALAKHSGGSSSTSASTSAFGQMNWSPSVQADIKPEDLSTDLFSNQESSNVIASNSFGENGFGERSSSGNELTPPRFFQFNQSYIIAETTSGLTLIDQNAAHQRVLFETSLQRLQEETQMPSQQLLFPEVLEFSPGEDITLNQHQNLFYTLGFEIEEFGKNCWQLRGIPAELPSRSAEEVFRNIINDLDSPELKNKEPEFYQRLARSFAANSAIPRNKQLHMDEMENLVDTLFATQNPYKAPDGKPTMIRISPDEILSRFGRN